MFYSSVEDTSISCFVVKKEIKLSMLQELGDILKGDLEEMMLARC